MKTKLLLIAFQAIMICSAYAQSYTLLPVNSSYSSSVPPEMNVYYVLTNSCNTSSPDTCMYSWNVTNGSVVGPTAGAGLKLIAIKWNNVNANGSIAVTVSNCSSSCNTTVNYSVPIRYLGNIGNMKINGTAYSGSYTLPCGTTPFTASVDAVTNATNYNWSFSSGGSGWSISGSGTSVTVTPSANSAATLRVIATRSDVSSISRTQTLSMSRPAPGAGVSAISGTDYLCSGTSSYSLSGLTGGMSASWSVANGSATIPGSSTGSSVNATYSYSGSNTLTATIYDAACAASTTRSKAFQVGTYSTSQFSVTGPTQTCPYPDATEVYVTINTSTAPSPISGYNWTYSSNWPFGYSPSGYDYKLVPPNAGFGSAWVRLSIQNGCGWSIPYQWDVSEASCSGFFVVSPNPASDILNVQFPETTSLTGSADAVELYSEATGEVVKRLSAQERKLKTNKKIIIDVSSLPKGTYFLRITDSKFTGNKTKVARVVLQ